jgi:tape measure domain-containing protein
VAIGAEDEVGARVTLKDKEKFRADVRESSREVESLGKKAETAGNRAKTSSYGFSSMATGIGKIKSAAALGVVGLGAVAGAAVTMGVKTVAANQNAQIAFSTMLGSGQKASAFLKDLQEFAAKTPFEFPELQTAASSLISAGIEAKNVIPIMTSLGNATSGMGTGSEGVKRATVALQQMNAAGRITAEDLNQLRDAGIPVYDLLAKATGKTKAEVANLASTGKLGKKELDQMMEALASGKGLERFNGLMDKQSASLSGKFSTLKDNIRFTTANMMEPFVGSLDHALDAMGSFTGKASAWSKNVAKQMPNLKSAISAKDVHGVAGVVDNMFGNTGKLIPVIEKIADVGKDIGRVWSQSVAPAFADVSNALGPLGAVVMPLGHIDDLLKLMADHGNVTRDVVVTLVGAFVLYKGVALGMAAADKYRAAMAWLNVVRQRAGKVATNENTAATVAQRIATLGVAGATKIASGAMRVLNLVMRASPWVFVATAIIGIGIALVAAYKRSATFRRIVQGAFRAVSGAAKAVWRWIKNNWPYLVGMLGGPFGLAAAWIFKHFGKVKGWFKSLAHAIGGFFTGVGDTIRGIFDGTVAIIKGAINGILSVFNAVIRGMDALQVHVNVGPVHYNWDGLGIPEIPMLAKGGTATRGGAAIVGENGPELLSLPTAASVVPLQKGSPFDLGALMGPREETIEIPVYLDGRPILKAVAKRARADVARS